VNIDQRIDLVKDRIERVKNCPWIDMVFAAEFTIMTRGERGKKADDIEKTLFAMSDMPGYGTNRWVADDFVGLVPILRAATLKFLEGKLAELEKLKEAEECQEVT
jgi:hypothetical protein